ncbi:MAG: hypothetical protein JRH08_00785 [Deltaproteobacteria bacterium]|nr:hypothetical protein [Deltaproteobacteria bacterium]MBW2025698.1 hypothetical protein [Deltaproteobacteria bacterium]MBW2124239.1 hypothetical protein [Deltaproteobacteria bacterium]
MANQFLKDPDAVLDYAFDWSSWLQSGETVSSYVITVDTGLTKESDGEADGVVTVWLSGGTAGSEYTVSCKITTSMSRTDERSMTIKVMER